MPGLLRGALRLLPLAALTALPLRAETPEPGGRLGIELNRLEPVAGGCRAYFLFRNDTGTSFEALQLSLAVFDQKGVIGQLLAIDAAPLPVARTILKLFDIPQTDCGAISQVLLHDIPACKPQNAEALDCYGLVALSSRAPAALVQ